MFHHYDYTYINYTDNTPEWHSDIESDAFMVGATNLMKAITDTLRAAKMAQFIPNNIISPPQSPPPHSIPPLSDLEATAAGEKVTSQSYNTVQQSAMSTTTQAGTVGVKLKFPFGFHSTELKRYTVLTKNS